MINMKSILFLNLVLAVLITISACNQDPITGSGVIATEARTIKNFTGVTIEGSSNVTILKGTDFKVEVKAYNNLLPYFESRVVNGNLILGYKDHINVRNDNTEVTVTLPVLNSLSTYGSGDITSTGDFMGNNDFEASISGSGNIKIEKGSSMNFSTSISGSGNVQAFGFAAEKVTVNVAGSGNAKVTATNKLNVKIAGSGNVYYKGSPSLSVNVSGSGAVVKQ